VRDLQAQWQHQARQLPLARGVEGALWTRFKAATDAVFAQRDAAFHARDAELAANLAECQALIDRVAALATVDDNAEIKRTLAEAERVWRQGGELPRGAGPAIVCDAGGVERIDELDDAAVILLLADEDRAPCCGKGGVA
jgi:hypothetical protein